MIRATPQMRDFARRVVAFEMAGDQLSGDATPLAFAICEKLRPQWTNLMGSIGYRTLLSRALSIAIPESGWLARLSVKANGTLGWADESDERLDADQNPSGSVALIAALFGLLEGFIGEGLALHLMDDVWPNLPPGDSDSDKGK